MPNRNHDPTKKRESSTTATLRETLENLKEEECFSIQVEIGGKSEHEEVQPG